MKTALWKKNASELARLIHIKEVSSVEVTGSVIERIEKVNPKINALVVPCLEQALQQARHWDAAPRQGALLGGVPFSVKEMIHVAGMPCTLGTEQRRKVVARQHATVVQRLLQAGGILLGLTNLPEGLLGVNVITISMAGPAIHMILPAPVVAAVVVKLRWWLPGALLWG